MTSSILNIGQSALAAAQAGLATTGHNIANASTPGYSRQIVIQSSAGSQNMGVGFIGKGTQVTDVRRVYSDLLAGQMQGAQTSQNQVKTYYTQISRINNLLADPAAGLSPTVQDFFKSVQDLATNPTLAASRQSVLSSAEALAARFQSLDGQLKEQVDSVNSEIRNSITTINVHAANIAKLNDAIEKAHGTADGKASNDLLDQRDLAIAELSKEIKTTVVKQGNSYNVFIGNGQPLVVGAKTMELVPAASPNDLTRTSVGMMSNGRVVNIPENSLPGGRLGGLLEFRSQTLDQAQNALGRIAIGLAQTFNAQHVLGQDQTGALGGTFFNVGGPVVQPNRNNTSAPAAQVSAVIADAGALTTSDYMIETISAADPLAVPPVAGSYRVVRQSDGAITNFTSFPQTVDGVAFNLDSGNPAAGDRFLVKPTVAGATEFSVAIRDVTKIAAAAPIRTEALTANAGTGKISAGNISDTSMLGVSGTLTFTASADPLVPGTLAGFPADMPITVTRSGVATTYPPGTPSVDYEAGDVVSFGIVRFSGIPTAADSSFNYGTALTLTHSDAPSTLTGFPPHMEITVTAADGTVTPVTADANGAIAYQPGDSFSVAGMRFSITGTPVAGDRFTVGPNTNGVGDNRNAVLLGALQTSNTLAGGTTSYQGAYAQLVSQIGNKTREMEVTTKAETRYLEQALAAQQSESGVNLDEEATNLLRYQQAYQAAGKVMQTASQLFDVLLSLGT